MRDRRPASVDRWGQALFRSRRRTDRVRTRHSGADGACCGRCGADASGDYRRLYTQRTGIAGIRLGLARQYYWDDLDPEVERVVKDALARLREAGAELVEVDISDYLDEANEIFWLLLNGGTGRSDKYSRATTFRCGPTRSSMPSPARIRASYSNSRGTLVYQRRSLLRRVARGAQRCRRVTPRYSGARGSPRSPSRRSPCRRH